MDLRNNRRLPIRYGIGVAALAALTLSGCGVGGAAEFGDGDAAANSGLEPVAADLITVPAESDVDSIVTADPVDVGAKSTIKVPSGELEVTGIASVDTVPSGVISRGSTPDEAAPSADGAEAPGDGGDAPADEADAESGQGGSDEEEMRAADGMELRLVTFTYTENDAAADAPTSGEDDGGAAEALASPTLALDIEDEDRALPKLDASGERTYLLSVPKKGAAELSVTQDGHEQKLDLRTGERVPDEVASTYYREQETRVEINEPLTFTEATARTGGDGQNEYDHTLRVSAHLEQAELTPWTPDEGWAEAGTAWVVLRGEVEFDTGLDQMMPSTANATFSVAPDAGEEATFEVGFDGHGSEDIDAVVAVPIATQTVSVSGQATINLKTHAQQVISENPVTVNTIRPYVIDFGPAPAESGASSEGKDGTDPAASRGDDG